MNKKRLEKSNKILILLAILFTLIFFKTFYNVYAIQRNDYTTRLVNNYGYCDKQGYGFVNETIKKRKIEENIKIINFDNQPNISALFFDFNKIYNKNYLILLNFNNKSNNSDSSIMLGKLQYQILDNYQNKCFFIKKIND
jgi:hypothetical protein